MRPRRPVQRANTHELEPWAAYVQDHLFEWVQHRDQLEAARRFLAEDGELYHYTTVEGLKGIVESHAIWATAASYLNDASEINYGCAVLDEVFEEWQRANRNIKTNAIKVLEILRGRFVGKKAKTDRAVSYYIACFCEKPNLLSQWRAYGQAGGYSIGFDFGSHGFAALESPNLLSVKPEKNGYKAKLVKVLYSPAEQRARLHAVLRFCLPQLDEPDALEILSRSTKAQQRGFVDFATLAIEMFLLEEIVGFKNKAFAEEHEWRIVLNSTIHQVNVPPAGVCFRPARGLIVPYLKIVSSQNKLPIKSVRLGPSLDKARAEKSVGLLCSANGYYSVKIEGSNIPVVL
jgi:hypothetical protein